MEERFREVLVNALEREGVSAAELAREFGLDKSYFIDLIAGRKKTVSALVYMMAARRLSFDPWEVAGLAQPARAGAVRQEAALPAPLPPAPEPEPLEVAVSMCVEEGAFRGEFSTHGRSRPPMPDIEYDRQSVAVVKGDDYDSWGVPSGTLLHLVSYGRYEGVAPGRLVVARSQMNGLSSHVLRRASLSPAGELVLELPGPTMQAAEDGGGELVGLVTAVEFPRPGAA